MGLRVQFEGRISRFQTLSISRTSSLLTNFQLQLEFIKRIEVENSSFTSFVRCPFWALTKRSFAVTTRSFTSVRQISPVVRDRRSLRPHERRQSRREWRMMRWRRTRRGPKAAQRLSSCRKAQSVSRNKVKGAVGPPSFRFAPRRDPIFSSLRSSKSGTNERRQRRPSGSHLMSSVRSSKRWDR